MAEYNLSTEIPFGDTRLAIMDTFRKWNADRGLWGQKAMTPDIEVNTRKYTFAFHSYTPENIALRRVTVRWMHPTEGERVVSCDKFQRVQDNARAIYLTLESMRMGEKRVGVATYNSLVRQVVGLIEGPKGQRDPYEVLGLRPDAPDSLIQAAYLDLAKSRHPDKGGSKEAFAELTEALEEVKRRRAVTA